MSERGWWAMRWRFWWAIIDRRPALIAFVCAVVLPFLYYLITSFGLVKPVEIDAKWPALYYAVVIVVWFETGAASLVHDLDRKLDKRSPRLSGAVEWHRKATLVDKTRILVAAIRIDNDGASTQVVQWRAVIRPGTPEQLKPPVNGDFSAHLDGGQTIGLRARDYLPHILNGRVLGRGRHRIGYVVFKLTIEPKPEDIISYTFKGSDRVKREARRSWSSQGEIKEFPPTLRFITQSTSRTEATRPEPVS
jgi:hypothetical protein